LLLVARGCNLMYIDLGPLIQVTFLAICQHEAMKLHVDELVGFCRCLRTSSVSRTSDKGKTLHNAPTKIRSKSPSVSRTISKSTCVVLSAPVGTLNMTSSSITRAHDFFLSDARSYHTAA